MLLTRDELKVIHHQARNYKNADELSMLVYLLFETGLRLCELLGWFNRDSAKRHTFLARRKKTGLLEEYEKVPVLFPRKHQTYLLQWKKACLEWTGRPRVTFNLLRKSLRKHGFH